ncbi:MAG: hypothetical protein ABI629_19095 [bacterium]
MTAPADARFAALAVAIVAGAVASLWYLLRRERPPALLGLLALSAAGLALRLLYTNDFPRGLNEDEPKVLAAAIGAVRNGGFLAESNISVPVLMHALFQGQLVAWFGPGFWAIRLYSLAGGVLCIPAAFAAARALGVGVAAAFGSAALIAVLPWALFYSRVMQGAELTFQQLLLIAALARLVFAPLSPPPARPPRVLAALVQPAQRLLRDGAAEALIASFALAWLAYGYWCTRAMFALPVLAALLARGRRAAWCLLPLLVGVLAYAPYALANRASLFVAQGLDPAGWGEGGGLTVLVQRTWETLQALRALLAQDGWLTVRAAALHPLLLLLLALAGALTSVRRAVFLGGGFALGLAPTVLAWGQPSTHRMLMAFPFIALAVGCAFDDLVPRRRWRALAVGVVGAATAVWSVSLYFSDDFWPSETRALFDWQRTALLDSLPFDAQPPVFFLRQVTQFREPRRLLAPDDRQLDADVWLPDAGGGLYAFSAVAAPLRPLYERLLGAERVKSFGDAFTVRFEPGDWTWLRAHGWMYQLRCGDHVRRAALPALHQMNISFAMPQCTGPATHVWVGRWLGPPARLRARASTPLVVRTPRGLVEAGSDADAVDFDVVTGDLLRLETSTPPGSPWSDAALYERTAAGERLPVWEFVAPP